jgi:tetratricopeptide (TPR) repeat protein
MISARNMLLAIALLFGGIAQGQILDDWIRLGDESLAENDPVGAQIYFEKAMQMDSAKALINYKYAEALRLNHQYKKAAFYYLKVYKRERGKVYPMSGIHLANMQMQSGQYAEAKENWRRVRNQFKDDEHGYWHQKALQEMRACELVQTWLKDTISVAVNLLPETINSDQSEFAGYFENDGAIQFTSLRGTFNDKQELTSKPEAYQPRLYLSDSTLSNVTLVESGLESQVWISHAVSADSTLEVSMFREEEQNVIVVKDIATNKILLSIPEEGDTAWYSHPNLGNLNGEKVLFVSSDRADGMGQIDIWIYHFENEKWENAGDKVNSMGTEVTPFYREDEQTLYFASDWHIGYGGLDLFSSAFSNGKFGYPVNLKAEFNSAANDLYYSFNNEIHKGSVTSNRLTNESNEGSCCNDLWAFDETVPPSNIPVIETLEDLNAYLPVTLYFHNDAPDPKTLNETTELDYLETYLAYTSLIPQYRDNYSKGLNENREVDAENEMDGFFSNQVDQGIQDLDLFTTLLANELSKGAQIEITVKGFASPLAYTEYNIKLTSRRISSLINYFKNYQRGALKDYMNGTAVNGGLLVFNEIPFGEYEASEYVSDNPNESDAIYGISAALERKIEITSVTHAKATNSLFDLRFESEILDLGLVKPTSMHSFDFKFAKAEGVQIDSVFCESNAITYEVYNDHIAGIIETGESPGKKNITLFVKGSFADLPKELHLTFEVE